MQKIKTKLYGLVVLAVLAMNTVSASAQTFSSSVELSALNTVAGNSTILRAAKLAPSSQVELAVKSPSGSITNVVATTNSAGMAIEELEGLNLQEAGDYLFNVRYPDSNYLSYSAAFSVSPSSVDRDNSYVEFSDSVVQSGDSLTVKVGIKDEFGNPIENTFVALNSDSGIDETLRTDSEGEANIELTQKSSGLVRFHIEELGSSMVLVDEMKILFVDDELSLFGSNYSNAVLANAGNSAGPIDSFIFEDIPSKLSPGEQYSATVTAVDALGETVTSYTGTVGFVVTSDNKDFAETPLTYEFITQDQGSHTFSLGFRFLKEGVYDVRVADLANTSVEGVQSFNVSSGEDSSSISSDSGLEITNPSAGTVSNNSLVISGLASPASTVKIFDNDIEIAEIVVGVSGEFSHTTGVLADGPHTFYVATINEVGTIVETSDPVQVVIDTQGAEFDELILSPSGQLDPGQSFEAKLVVPEALSKAQIVLDNNVYDLELTQDGNYAVEIAAPIAFGEYQIDVVLVDELGNQEKFSDEATISVGQAPPAEEPKGPGSVSGIVAESGDQKVILTWDSAEAGDNEIVRYRVYYGTSATELTQAVDTFTTSNTWYVPDLINEQLYYFSVIAVDSTGLTSESFAFIAAATPSAPIVEDVDLEVENGTAGQEAIEDMEKDVSDSGPALDFLILCSVLLGWYYSSRSRKRPRLDC